MGESSPAVLCLPIHVLATPRSRSPGACIPAAGPAATVPREWAAHPAAEVRALPGKHGCWAGLLPTQSRDPAPPASPSALECAKPNPSPCTCPPPSRLQYKLGASKLAVRLVNGRLMGRAGAGLQVDFFDWLAKQQVAQG